MAFTSLFLMALAASASAHTTHVCTMTTPGTSTNTCGKFVLWLATYDHGDDHGNTPGKAEIQIGAQGFTTRFGNVGSGLCTTTAIPTNSNYGRVKAVITSDAFRNTCPTSVQSAFNSNSTVKCFSAAAIGGNRVPTEITANTSPGYCGYDTAPKYWYPIVLSADSSSDLKLSLDGVDVKLSPTGSGACRAMQTGVLGTGILSSAHIIIPANILGVPSCGAACPTAPPLPANAVSITGCSAGSPSGTVCTVTCRQGYELVGGTTRCDNGNYVIRSQCTDQRTCSLQDAQNAVSRLTSVSGAGCGTDTVEGNTCLFNCQLGYYSTGTVTCDPGTNQWVLSQNAQCHLGTGSGQGDPTEGADPCTNGQTTEATTQLSGNLANGATAYSITINGNNFDPDADYIAVIPRDVCQNPVCGQASSVLANTFIPCNQSGSSATRLVCGDGITTGLPYAETDSELGKVCFCDGSARGGCVSLGDFNIDVTVVTGLVTNGIRSTLSPSSHPTKAPSSSIPTINPTSNSPTENPTSSPTSNSPTENPTSSPTSNSPTENPTSSPTENPTSSPTSNSPTENPTSSPTSNSPTENPTSSPTSNSPTSSPTVSPTSEPTQSTPTISPTISPTLNPSSSEPTRSPTISPTLAPSSSTPTLSPTTSPTQLPSWSGHLQCIDDVRNGYIGFVNNHISCESITGFLNTIMAPCTENAIGRWICVGGLMNRPPPGTQQVTFTGLKAVTEFNNTAECVDMTDALNTAAHEHAFLENTFDSTCSLGRYLQTVNNSACQQFVDALMGAIDSYRAHRFDNCTVTTPTTTQSTTQTTTATSTSTTIAPSVPPTMSPTTRAPTQGPTMSPTAPSVSPTMLPTLSPTAPSVSPTMSPAPPTRGPGTLTCYAAGDPHYKTFDNIFFDWMGKCDYQLVGDCREHGTMFAVHQRNNNPAVPVTWIKAIAVRMPSGDVIELDPQFGDKILMAGNTTAEPMTWPLYDVSGHEDSWSAMIQGGQKSIRVPSLGVEVIWNDNHYAQVLLEPTSVLIGSTCGLCGDADGDQSNDTEIVSSYSHWKAGGEEVEEVFIRADPQDGPSCVDPDIMTPCVCNDEGAAGFCAYLAPGGEYSDCPGYGAEAYAACMCDYCYDRESARLLIQAFDDFCRPLVDELATLAPTPGPTMSPTAPSASPTMLPTEFPTQSTTATSTLTSTATSTMTTTPITGLVECRPYNGWWYLVVDRLNPCDVQVEQLVAVARSCNGEAGAAEQTLPLRCTPSGLGFYFLQATDPNDAQLCDDTIEPLNMAMEEFSRLTTEGESDNVFICEADNVINHAQNGLDSAGCNDTAAVVNAMILSYGKGDFSECQLTSVTTTQTTTVTTTATTFNPTRAPSMPPTISPSTTSPTGAPTRVPSNLPTSLPSADPCGVALCSIDCVENLTDSPFGCGWDNSTSWCRTGFVTLPSEARAFIEAVPGGCSHYTGNPTTAPSTSEPTQKPTSSPTMSPSVSPSTSSPTSGPSTSPTSSPTVTCHRRCGSIENGGGTCFGTDILNCSSCDRGMYYFANTCSSVMHCDKRVVPSGLLTGTSCRCFNRHCHKCTISHSEDSDVPTEVCKKCRDGWYLNDNGTCTEDCDADKTKSGANLFGRRCLDPFTCRSGGIMNFSVSYGCKCPNADNSRMDANCHTCDFNANEYGQRCTKCRNRMFLEGGSCHSNCSHDPALIEYRHGNYGSKCVEPFVCTNGRHSSSGETCKCEPRECNSCHWGYDGVACLDQLAPGR